jgi:hypothetical protein
VNNRNFSQAGGSHARMQTHPCRSRSNPVPTQKRSGGFVLACIVCITVFALALPRCQASTGQTASNAPLTGQLVKHDYRNFYTRERFTRLGIDFGIGGTMANTHIDQGIRDWYQDHVRTTGSNNAAKIFKTFGDGYYTIPVSILAMELGVLGDGTPSLIGEWGQLSFRAYLLGGPPTLFAQVATGGSRPQEREDASHWRPFQDSNGVSGHAFVGAIPFLTIADMSSNPYLRYSAYVASTFTGWSRINDDAHFASQVFLGWELAYESTDAVNHSDTQAPEHTAHILILPWPHGVIAAMAYHW